MALTLFLFVLRVQAFVLCAAVAGWVLMELRGALRTRREAAAASALRR